MGRPTNEERLLKQLIPKKEVSDTRQFGEFVLPNLSGKHDAGRITQTPTIDTQIVNKKYVDDQVAAIDLSPYVPYTGATANVDLGIYDLTATQIGVGKTNSTALISAEIYAPDGGQGIRVQGYDANRLALSSYIAGDSNVRFTFRTDGLLGWGSGAATTDTNLYRSNANELKTDDNFIAANITAAQLSGNSLVLTGASDTLTLTNLSPHLFSIDIADADITTLQIRNSGVGSAVLQVQGDITGGDLTMTGDFDIGGNMFSSGSVEAGTTLSVGTTSFLGGNVGIGMAATSNALSVNGTVSGSNLILSGNYSPQATGMIVGNDQFAFVTYASLTTGLKYNNTSAQVQIQRAGSPIWGVKVGATAPMWWGTFAQANEPTTTDIPNRMCAWWIDTDTSGSFLCYNHDGTIKTVALT